MQTKPLLLILLMLAGLTGCAGPLLRDDSLNAADYRQRAEAEISRKDYEGAVRSLDAAIRLNPGQGTLYLRQGEVLETLARDRQASRTYRAALTALPDSPEKAEAAFRLALLEALKLGKLQMATSLLPALAEGSPERFDLQGVIALQQDNPREALRNFGRAQQVAGPRRIGLILYHAALAYHRLGDEENTSSSLFHAINQASNLAEAKDIERFYRSQTGR